jgi:hypothetical protein
MTTATETAREAPPTAKPLFPFVTWRDDRGYVQRSDLNRYKAELQAASLGVAPTYPPIPDFDPLIPLMRVAEELGVHRRTVGRLIAESGRGIGRRHAGTPIVETRPAPATA